MLTLRMFGDLSRSSSSRNPSKPYLRKQELSLGGISLMKACRIGLVRWVMAVTSKIIW